MNTILSKKNLFGLFLVLLPALVVAAVPAKTAKPKTAAKAALPPNPKKLAPPPGIPIEPSAKAELQVGAAQLGKEISALRASLASKPALLDFLPDVQIFHNAVCYALEDDIIYNANQITTARNLLKQGMERAGQLRAGQAPWNTATGLVVRGYVSHLDASVQPYGLVVPADYKLGGPPRRLDFWFHGRGDTLSELAFIEGRLKSPGEFTPERTLVLHPYGRFCNASKFAGEMDAFEALEDVSKHYPVDTNRIVIRGFSMGGATAWHIGAHHASRWAAVNPGAGFVDVKNYQKLTEKLDTIPWYEQKLWNFYDPLSCAINLVNTTLVAYSGEDDGQKAAADLMDKALAQQGVKMTHIIGPKTGHKYEPEAKKKVAALVDAAAQRGRTQTPAQVRFVTYSLKYNQMHWVEVLALEKHWEKSEVDANLENGKQVTLKTKNITSLALHIPQLPPVVIIDGQSLPAVKSGPMAFVKENGQWHSAPIVKANPGLAKQHNLQGPIDDAFLSSFLMVRPTGTAMNATTGKWTETEMKEALFQWRRQFRGEAQVKDDTAITDNDIQNHNLILWGDPTSNKLLARIAGQLPVRWTAAGVVMGGKTYDANKQVPAMIYPNPLNPKRYIVINSGFTFPQFGTTSNSQQTPKLPDWAILDMSVPVNERTGGNGIIATGFFGEHWE